MADSPVQAVLTAAAEVLDDAALHGLGDCLAAADPLPPALSYRGLVDVLDGLAAAGPAGAAVADFLSGDAVVLARMNAAVEVMLDAGFEVDRGGDLDGHLRRAAHWRRRAADGSLSALHRRCALDIGRGSLRLWVRAGGVPQPVPEPSNHTARVRNRQVRTVLLRSQVRLARVQLGVQARTMCAALRTDLGGAAAELPRGGLHGFEGRVRREVRRVGDEFDAALALRLTELAEAVGMSAPEPGDAPRARDEASFRPRRWPPLENRLTALLGIGFGCSVSLAAGRVLTDVRPDWAPFAVLGCAGIGVLLTCWVVGARRLLAERVAMERGVAEAVADLRAAMEERMVTRLLDFESALAVASADPVPECRPAPAGHPPNYPSNYLSQSGPR